MTVATQRKPKIPCKKCGEGYDNGLPAFLCSLRLNPDKLEPGNIIEEDYSYMGLDCKGHRVNYEASKIYIIFAGGEIERGYHNLSHQRKYLGLSCVVDSKGHTGSLSFHSHLSVDIGGGGVREVRESFAEVLNRGFVDTPGKVPIWASLFRSLIRDKSTYSDREQEIIRDINNSLTHAIDLFKKVGDSL